MIPASFCAVATNQCFDEFVGFCGGWSDYYQWHLRFNDSLSKGNGDYLTEVLTKSACKYIKRHQISLEFDKNISKNITSHHSSFHHKASIIWKLSRPVCKSS